MWQALEDRQCWDDTRNGWASDSGVPLRWLHPTDHLAASITLADGRTLPIIEHPDGEVIAVCPETGSRIDVDPGDRVIYEFDVDGSLQALARACDLRGNHERVAQRLWRLGDWAPIAGDAFPVFMSLAGNTREFESHAGIAASRSGGPFVLLSGSGRWHRDPTRSVANGTRSAIASIRSLVEVKPDGAIVQARTMNDALPSFLAEHSPVAAGVAQSERFPTPPGSSWSDVQMRFIDGHTVRITVGEVVRHMTYHDMGLEVKRSKKPDVQFELLRVFAEAGGELDWKTHGADRANQKRRERLAAALQDLFRIEGDPFEYDASLKGWRTRFSVESD